MAGGPWRGGEGRIGGGRSEDVTRGVGEGVREEKVTGADVMTAVLADPNSTLLLTEK